MKQTKIIMGMPVIVTIDDNNAKESDIQDIFSYFDSIDRRFSTYKEDSEITRINKKKIHDSEISSDMRLIFALAEDTKNETNGYFDITKNGFIDPSGIVKGWAIYNAAQLLQQKGYKNFMIDAGGDIQVVGVTKGKKKWRVGITNPFNIKEMIKVFSLSDQGIATSGSYVRGNHIYNPHDKSDVLADVVSVTVIGPTVYDADRFATAAFAMGEKGIHFIESLDGYEGYMINAAGFATMTTGLHKYIV